MPLLLQNQVRPFRAGRCDQHQRVEVLFPRARDQRHGAPFAVARDADAFLVDVLALLQPLKH